MTDLFEEHKKALEENGLINGLNPNSAVVKFVVNKHVEVSRDFAIDFCDWVCENQLRFLHKPPKDTKKEIRQFLKQYEEKK